VSDVLENIDDADELAPLHAQIAASLPKSWALETLGSLCEKSQYGWTTKADKAGDGVKFLRTTDITPGVVDWSSVPYCVEAPSDLEKYLIKDGDILISRTGSIGVNYLVVKPEPAVFASYLIRFRPKTSISTKYLKYYLQSPAYWRAINTGKKGIAVQNVNATMLSRIPVPVAPPDVQVEIVAELEKQFSRLDEAVANLQRVKANLKRYKASVLKDAVEGRLVPLEADLARREGRSFETGGQLLQRIFEERRAKWTGKGKFKEPMAQAAQIAIALPDGWTSATVDQLGNVQLGKMLDKQKHTAGVPYRYLRNINVRWGTFDVSDVFEMNFEVDELERFSVRAGDVLVCEGGEPARSAVWRYKQLDMKYQKALHRVRFDGAFLPDLLVIVLEHMAKSGALDELYGGSTIKHFTRETFVKLVLPVPPIAEQARIVAEVDRHLTLARGVEAEVDANIKRAQALRQSTLARAFST